ncbi:MAG: FUSC family protein [Neisseriaceae bacterium]|jgi:uncharacterized membrane protein YgaE (UPF0421/DUF939 family)
MKYYNEKLIRSLRIVLATLIAELIYIYYKEPHYAWVFITIYVVLFDQATIGATFYKGFLRLMATISGGTVGFLTLFIFKNNELANSIAILLTSLVYSYIFINQKQSYIGVLGLATLAMILVGNSEMGIALYRIGNILLGIIIALIVTLVFFPQSAEKVTLKLIYSSITKLRDTMEILLEQNNDKKIIQQHFDKIEAGILAELSNLVKSIDEIKYEGKSQKRLYYLDALRAIRRIYRIITVLFQSEAYIGILDDKDIVCKLTKLQNYYTNLFKVIQNKQYNLDLINQIVNISNLSNTHHDVVFIHNLIDRIYIETNILVNSINQARNSNKLYNQNI